MKVYLAVVIEGSLGIEPAKVRLTEREAELDAELLRRMHQYKAGTHKYYARVKVVEAIIPDTLLKEMP